MHLTVYHARRPMSGASAVDEEAHVIVPTAETRFMVLAPGGETRGRKLEPRHCKVGIRVQRKILRATRSRSFANGCWRTRPRTLLGGRRPSTAERNAFGARHFQPHIALVRPGNRIDRDLTKIGELFRQAIKQLTVDRFSIDIVRKDNTGKRFVPR